MNFTQTSLYEPCSYILYQEVEKIQFSESIDTYDEKMTFQDINVSRPLMKVRVSLDID